MLEDEEKDDEIDIDFGKIKNFFKRKKKEVVKEVRDDSKELKEEIKEKKVEEKEIIKEDQEEIKKEEKKVEELKKEEKEVKEVEKKIEKDPVKAKEKIDEIKDDVEDEEINIDFSKIKGWFKGLTKEEKEITEDRKTEVKEEDEEISFDFKKVKNIFKGLKEKTKEEKTADEEEISFDFRAVSNFFVKHKALFLILIPLIISIYLRTMPAYLPVTDEWAENSVYSGIKGQIKSQIDSQYPNLPDANKAPLVEAEFKKVLENEKQFIENQIKGTSEYFKSRLKDNSGQTYLLAIDPYYWMRQAQNIVDHGYPGDEIRDGIEWDTHMFAPNGRQADSSLHAYIEAYLFKFMRLFNKDIELMTVVFYVPIIISALAVIPAFFIARRFGGNFGGFVAAIIIAIHPSYLTRTAGGFADTDAYNVMFPLFITWFFLEAFKAESMKKKVIYAALAAFSSALFEEIWIGSWFIFDFLIAVAGIYIIYTLISTIRENKGKFNIKTIINNKPIKNTLILIALFVFMTAIFLSLFSGVKDGFGYVINAPGQPIGFSKIKVVGTYSVWPNVYTTVAEQNEASLGQVVNSNGGKFLFFLSLVGILFTLTQKHIKRIWFIILSAIWYMLALYLTNDLIMFLIFMGLPLIIRLFLAIKDNEKEIDIKYAVLLIIWFAATIYASTKGVRFTLLLVPAFGVALGVCLGVVYRYASEFISKGIRINSKIAKIITIIILCSLLLAPYKTAKGTVRGEIPSMNDAWWSSLEKIKLESEPDAIVNSWWDFGHWFKMIADRAVTFDGTSQGTPQAHWIGNSLLTNDEDTAIGILRMLDCSGYVEGSYAFKEVNKNINDIPRSVDILYEIMVLDKEEARAALEEYEFQNVDEILEYTHCDPPENYFITSEDMIGKSGVWAHFGSWSFDRALMYNFVINEDDKEKNIEFLEQRFELEEDEAEDIYYEIESLSTNQEVNNWISPWPGYASGLSGCSKKDDIVECGTGIRVNLEDYTAEIPTPDGIKHPNSLVYATKEGIEKREYTNNTVGVSAALIPSGDGFQSILMSPELADSMFTRLFFIEGHGLKHFKKFSDERSVFGGRVIVWKVDWEGSEANIMDEFIEKPLNETIEDIETEIEEELVVEEEVIESEVVENKTNKANISIE